MRGTDYRVHAGTDAARDDHVAAASSKAAQPLVPGKYYWRVAAVDAHEGAGPFSDTQDFRRVPPGPTVEAPAFDDKQMTLRWRAGLPGQQSQVQPANNEKFDPLALDTRTAGGEITLPRPPGGTYFIRTRTLDTDGFEGPFGHLSLSKYRPHAASGGCYCCPLCRSWPCKLFAMSPPDTRPVPRLSELGWVAAVVPVLVAWGLATQSLRRIDNLIYDYTLKAWPAPSRDDIVIVVIDAASLRDRFVLVGPTAADMASAFATPVSGENRPLAGVEFDANVLAALLNRAWILPLPPLVGAVVSMLVVVLLPLLAYPRLSPRLSLLPYVGSIAATLGAAVLLLHVGHLWVAPAASLLGLMAGYPLWGWRRLQLAGAERRWQMEHARVTLKSIGEVVVTPNVTGTILYLNPTAERLSGWDLKTACGQHYREIFAPDDRAAEAKMRAALFALPSAW